MSKRLTQEQPVLRMVYYSANGTEIELLREASHKINGGSKQSVDLVLLSRESLGLSGWNDEIIAQVARADVLIIVLHGGKESCPHFDALVNGSSLQCAIYVQGIQSIDMELSATYSTVSQEVHQRIFRYLSYGAEKNMENLMRYLIHVYQDSTAAYEEPCQTPWEGIYYKGFQEPLEKDFYYKQIYIKRRLSVGLVFHREHWLNRDTEYIDAFIEEFQQREINVIPVFRKSRKEEGVGNLAPDEVLREYFMYRGEKMVDILLNLMSFSANILSKDRDIIQAYYDFGVPVVKAIAAFSEREEWNQNPQGLSPVDIITNIVLPEFDGNIITIPSAFYGKLEKDVLLGTGIKKHIPDKNRVSKIADMVTNQAKLRHIANADKKIAIMLHNYPPRNDTIGSAFGLDSYESIRRLLLEMKKVGYTLDEIPKNGQDIIRDILKKATNDRSWSSPEHIHQAAVDHVDAKEYQQWFANLDALNQEQMNKAWGASAEDPLSFRGKIAVPGLINGNIFIGIQPSRGFSENPQKIYHDPDLPIPHQYYSYYEWIRRIFKADAVIHVGMHGNLEWLPGKSVGLSECCYPEIAISDLPNFYIYIINNPGEGTQAKRRSFCCIIDHLIPSMVQADTYDETAELENQIEEYYQVKLMDKKNLPIMKAMIWDLVLQSNLCSDIGVDEKQIPENFDDFLEILHGYIGELKDTQIKKGLHLLGQAPQGEDLLCFLVSITRLSNGEIPSLRSCVAEVLGYDMHELLQFRGALNANGRSNVRIIEEVHLLCTALIREIVEKEDPNPKEITRRILGKEDKRIEDILNYLSIQIVPKIQQTEGEIQELLRGLKGEYVLPGASGNPTRGMADILPTGRNFFSVDPQTVPSQAAWQGGISLGENLLEKFLAEEGCYPENIGMVLLGTPSMRTKGEDIAEALYLMGVKPIWKAHNGHVEKVELIPLEELGRPRIDVTLRISGMFRDAFPNLIELFDDAVNLVATAEEPGEENYIRKHTEKDMLQLLQEGKSLEDAQEESAYRIFGCKPGSYGAGVCNAIEAKNWKTLEDLTQIYVQWGGYGYSKKNFGKQAFDSFQTRLKTLDAAVMNLDSREFELMDSDDFYSFHGGLVASVTSCKGKAPLGLVGDSSNPDRIKTRTIAEESKFELRSRILNPKWIDSMKNYGYKGAGDISQVIDHIFGWDATTNMMESWMYDGLAEKFVLDPRMNAWFREVNPHALYHITQTLLEAMQRGMWQATKNMEKELRGLYLELEGTIEDMYE